MRLWSLHPRYLDPKGLVALWREGLLARAVLSGQTRGYTRHPQLFRFVQSPEPVCYINAYLQAVLAEAERRRYRFDGSKIDPCTKLEMLSVTRGQLNYEWEHLRQKLAARAPSWLEQVPPVHLVEPHPLFQVITGSIAPWEILPS